MSETDGEYVFTATLSNGEKVSSDTLGEKKGAEA